MLLLVLAATTLFLGATVVANAYPKILFDAVQKVYAPRKAHVDGLCREQIGPRVYVLVDVTLVKSGRARSVAFVYKRGWFGIWRDGKIMSAVPKSQDARWPDGIKELHRFCGS